MINGYRLDDIEAFWDDYNWGRGEFDINHEPFGACFFLNKSEKMLNFLVFLGVID